MGPSPSYCGVRIVQCTRLLRAVSGKFAKTVLRVLLDGQAQEDTCELCTALLSYVVCSMLHLVRLRRPRPRCSSRQNCLRRITKMWGASQPSLQHSVASVHRVPGDEPSKHVTSFRVAEVYTVPRLRRLLLVGAAIGWLQRNSSRLKESRLFWPGRRGTRGDLRRVGFSA